MARVGNTSGYPACYLECSLQIHGEKSRKVMVDTWYEWAAFFGILILVPTLIWAWMK